jgi:hypothetical protein
MNGKTNDEIKKIKDGENWIKIVNNVLNSLLYGLPQNLTRAETSNCSELCSPPINHEQEDI